jgi:hypothetical protein
MVNIQMTTVLKSNNENVDRVKCNVVLNFLMSQITIIFYYLAQCQKKITIP